MISLLVSAILAAPVPINPESVFTPNDMPAYVQKAGHNRFVPTRTKVRADGTVEDCTVERASGDPKLDAFTCSLIIKRAKFRPAIWLDGSPVLGVFRGSMNWTVGGPPSKNELERAYPADLEINGELSPSAHPGTKVRVLIAVDENGKVVGCSENPPSAKDRSIRFPELVLIACQQVVSEFLPEPETDASGQPVPFVENVTVVFNPEQS